MFAPTSNPAYGLLLLAGIGTSLWVWRGMTRRDPSLIPVYLSGLLGAFTGAKLVYLAAEGWMFWDHPQRWLIWASGKTILGALLGGYAGVELAKRALGYSKITGDLFAVVAPIGITFGRIGCLLHGCCLGARVGANFPSGLACHDPTGQARWPAVPLELGFNLGAIAVFALMRKRHALPGQHFHLYLIAYGAFRLLHETMRDTPRLPGTPVTGYQIAAAAVMGLGIWGFAKRQRANSTGGCESLYA